MFSGKTETECPSKDTHKRNVPWLSRRVMTLGGSTEVGDRMGAVSWQVCPHKQR